MSSKEPFSIQELIPSSILPSVENYVLLMKKYYEFMNLEGNPSEILNRDGTARQIENATSLFLTRIYNELGQGYFKPEKIKDVSENIFKNLGVIYRAKGSLESINVLFSIVFGEEVEYWLPKDFILRASDGDWKQDFSLTCEIISGDPFDIIGVFAQVETTYPGQPTQRFEAEISRIDLLDGNKCRVYLSRFSIKAFYDGSTIKYKNVELRLIDTTNTILKRISGGSGFKRGSTFPLRAYNRNYVSSSLSLYGQAYVDRLSKYFNTRISNRRYISEGNRLNKYEFESVSRQSYTDGVVIEDIRREYENYRLIKYGKDVIKVSFGPDGNRQISQQIDNDNYDAPSILVDWDIIIEEVIKISAGVTTGPFYTFLTEIGPHGFARADLDNNGSIDIDDVENLLRVLMGFKINPSYENWFRTKLQTDLLQIAYPTPTLISNDSAVLLPVLFDEFGSITQERFITFGYNYPMVFAALLENDVGDPAIYLINSESVAKDQGYYNDIGGFLSDQTKIQDNDFYQEFSYVIRSGVTFDQFKNVIDRMIHPAGMKAFSEQLITQQINLESDIDDLLSFIYTELLYELTYATANYNNFIMNKPLVDTIQTSINTNINIRKGNINDVAIASDALQILFFSLYVQQGYIADEDPIYPPGYGYVGITGQI